ncbi:MobF family relaxase [Kitasatospora sp. NPDC048298]|uniref:MobF family relaxase n=1 Tax=Kitasatospora sp. NPDC048298 TaxID=3364049 RepID=UPI00371D7657
MTPIRAAEQVTYRLSRDCGCDVDRDAQVEYRLASERDLRWIGSGLSEVGLTAGEAVDPDAARALMDGRDPRTGAQLVKRKQAIDPRGKLPARALVDAIRALAEADGVTAAAYLRGGPLAERYARAERGLRREGDRHLLPLADAERLAAAAGLPVEVVYDTEVVNAARPFAGRHVDVGLRGVDLVLDIPKSISTAWALAPDELAAAIEEEWLASVGEAVAALEQWTAYGMAGHHGDGQRAERVATSGLLGWTTLHRSARPVDGAVGDPHLHVHVNIAHLAKGEDGQWRTIAAGAEDLMRHAHLTNEIAEARLRQRLTERHGARFTRSESTGAWELDGVDGSLRAAFSRRHAQVVAAAGPDATRDQQKSAARRSAEAKVDGDQAVERTDWRARAVATLVGDLSVLNEDERLVVLAEADHAVDTMVCAALPGPEGPAPTSSDGPTGPVLPTPERIASRIWDDPEHGLVASKKVVGHTHVLAAVVQELPYLDSVEQLVELVDQVLAVDGHAVRLRDSDRHHQVHRQRYTHTSVLVAESTIIRTTATGLGRGLAQLSPEAAGLTIATVEAAKSTADQRFEFSAEQRAVVVRLLCAGHGVEAVVGTAGAGKTTLMEAARAGWEAAGLRVVGASTAAVAAANLSAEAGIDSRTIAAWTRDISGGRGLDGVGVLIIDEAGMADDRALAALLRHAAEVGTKVVTIGDPLQLRAVGVGGGFARVHQLVDGLVLGENRRQTDPVERAALEAWRDGGRTSALAMLAGHGRVHAVDTVDQAHTSMLASWDAARTRWSGDPHGQVAELLLLAARRVDVAELNAGARALLLAAGELDGGLGFRAPDGALLEFAAGDIVHIRQNDYRSRRNPAEVDVLNGFRGVALEVDQRRGVLVEWRRPHDDGEQRTDRAWMSPRDVAEGRLTHGYAMTIGSAQGLTSEVTIASGRGADAHSLYPALSRARQETHLWLPLAELEDDVTRLTLGDPRTGAERLDRAVAAYGRQLERSGEDVMVVDELAAAEQAVPPVPGGVPVADLHRHTPGDVPVQPQDPPAVEQPEAFRTGRVLPPEPPAPPVPHWRERPHGGVGTGALLPHAERAEADARQARATAHGLDARADQLAAVLGTDQAPGRQRVAETVAHLDAAEQLLGRASDADQAADGVDTRIGELYATNHEEMRAEQRIRERAALRRSAVFLQRSGMLEAAAALRQRADERVAQIEELRGQARDLRNQAEDLRRQARAEVDLADGGAYGTVEQRIAQRRATLPELAERLDQRDQGEYQRLVTEAGAQRRTADQLDARAAGLRGEVSVRENLSPGRRVTEETERATAAVQAHQRRIAAQARAEELRRQQQYEYRYEPPTQGRSGPSIGR